MRFDPVGELIWETFVGGPPRLKKFPSIERFVRTKKLMTVRSASARKIATNPPALDLFGEGDSISCFALS